LIVVAFCVHINGIYYAAGDAGYFDDDGNLHIMTRIDDIINVSGVRLSTGAIEEILSSHKDVAECAVVGVQDEFRGTLYSTSKQFLTRGN